MDNQTVKTRFNQLGDDYKKVLKELQKAQKEIEDKVSRIKQQEVEISHLTDQNSVKEKKILSLTKDDSELSYYRGSVNSINSLSPAVDTQSFSSRTMVQGPGVC